MTEFNTVFLNGKWLPAADAQISVFDRGFLFGDGIYEVLPVYGHHLLRLDEHLERLANSLDEVAIRNPYSQQEWRELFCNLLLQNNAENCAIYLQITRGSSGGRDHSIPSDIEPTVFACVNPLPAMPDSVKENGVSAISREDIRWHRCHIKAITLLANVLLKEEGSAEGCNETLLVRDGNVSEGASSNVFALINNVLVTPPKGPELLPGITRDLVLELARQQPDLAVEERILTESELRTATEILITSSTRELYPVTELDGKAVGNGKPGAVWSTLFAAYQAYKAQFQA
jgi:D-alanine transaminase